mgnify:CR=1 FL=1|tara:strand:- start:31 stop:237 length:207 start_codon:yes stop_codon:yes gene_type:complete
MDELIEKMEQANLHDLDTLTTALWWVVLEDNKIYGILGLSNPLEVEFLNGIAECISIARCFEDMRLSN